MSNGGWRSKGHESGWRYGCVVKTILHCYPKILHRSIQRHVFCSKQSECQHGCSNLREQRARQSWADTATHKNTLKRKERNVPGRVENGVGCPSHRIYAEWVANPMRGAQKKNKQHQLTNSTEQSNTMRGALAHKRAHMRGSSTLPRENMVGVNKVLA